MFKQQKNRQNILNYLELSNNTISNINAFKTII